MIKRFVSMATLVCSLYWSTSAMAISPENQAVLDELLLGNAQFASGQPLSNLAAKSTPSERATVALAQAPKAIILDCSDSRLSPEILFDKGLGEVFVVRVAGNVIAPHQVASIEYAIEHLKAKLIVVLSHERCGAVTAAYGSLDAAGNLNASGLLLTPDLQNLVTTKSLKDAVVTTKAGSNSVTDCILLNGSNVYKDLTDPVTGSEVIRLAPAGELSVVEAFYDLDDGKVTVTAIDGVATATPATSIHTVNSSPAAAALLHGSIAPSGDSAVVNGGGQTFTITPDPGYILSSVTGTCSGTLNGNKYTVSNVTTNCTVVANFTAFVAPATMLPSVPATLTGTTQTFSWTNTGATLYQLHIGTSGAGSADIGYFPNPASNVTSTTVGMLPKNGSTVYVRLYSLINNSWQWNDYQYTAYTTPVKSAMLPAVPTTIAGGTQTFAWTSTGATAYQMWIGTSGFGSAEIGYYPNPGTTATSFVATGLPTSGTVFVRLYSLIEGAWSYNDYSYPATP